MLGLFAKKLGMTQVFSETDGTQVAVTVLALTENTVIEVNASKNGYSTVVLGFDEVKETELPKAEVGKFKKAGTAPKRLTKEFQTDISKFALGQNLTCQLLQSGDVIDVQGTSKGKGFQGVMRRHHFGGGRDSHGASLSHRVPGSIGNRAWPGRVFPNKRMAGHMGDETVTVKNLKVVAVEAEKNLVLVKGSIPGGVGSVVVLTPRSARIEDRVTSGLDQTASQTA